MIIKVAGLPKHDANNKIYFYEKGHSEKDFGSNQKA